MKEKKKFFIGITIGILFSTVSVYAVSVYSAKDINFKPSNTNWKVNNVNDALNELNTNKKSLKLDPITSNSVKGMRTASNVVTLELSNPGKYLCYCNYSTASANKSKGSLTTVDTEHLKISGCSDSKIIDTKSRTLSGKSAMGYDDGAYYLLVSETKVFSCDITEPSTISCTGTSGDANSRIPYNNHISCIPISQQ